MVYHAFSNTDYTNLEFPGRVSLDETARQDKEGSLDSLLDLIESMESEGKHFLIY